MVSIHLLELTESLANGVSRFAACSSSDVRIPTRRADASVYLGASAAAAATYFSENPGLFPPFRCVQPVQAVLCENGWLLFTLTDACFDALAASIAETCTPAKSDLERHTLNRMLALSRKGGTGCPRNSGARRALLLTLALPARPGSLCDAERALLTFPHALPPRERPALLNQCGAFADACARILYAEYIRRVASQ